MSSLETQETILTQIRYFARTSYFVYSEYMRLRPLIRKFVRQKYRINDIINKLWLEKGNRVH